MPNTPAHISLPKDAYGPKKNWTRLNYSAFMLLLGPQTLTGFDTVSRNRQLMSEDSSVMSRFKRKKEKELGHCAFFFM